jgi:hypothetical protein
MRVPADARRAALATVMHITQSTYGLDVTHITFRRPVRECNTYHPQPKLWVHEASAIRPAEASSHRLPP